MSDPTNAAHLTARRALLAEVEAARGEADFERIWTTHGNEWAVRAQLSTNPYAPEWIYRQLFSGGWFDHMLLTSTRAHPTIATLKRTTRLGKNDVATRSGYQNRTDEGLRIVQQRARFVLKVRGVEPEAHDWDDVSDFK